MGKYTWAAAILTVMAIVGVAAMVRMIASEARTEQAARDAAIAEFGADLEDLADTVRRLQAAQAQQKGAE